MSKTFLSLLFLLIFSLAFLNADAGKSPPKIHALVDIAHEFTFYFDGRFENAYLKPIGGVDARCWSVLSAAYLSNINLLVIPQGNTPCPYTADDLKAVLKFVREDGGGLLMIGNYGIFKGEKDFKLNQLANRFGIEFVKDKPKGKLRILPNEIIKEASEVQGQASGILQWREGLPWRRLVVDEEGRAVVAVREFGKGRVCAIHGSGLLSDKPKDGEAINAKWLCPLLQWLSANKEIDPTKPPEGTSPEKEKVVEGGLKVQYSAYLESYADEIVKLYFKVAEQLREIMGVPLAEGMNTTLILLPTGGGGFSSGVALGIGVWWGGFPENPYAMIELIGHEATHSWVLPFPEPMWNEGIATYMGIEVGKRLGYVKEAEESRKGWASACEKIDPNYNKIDISQPEQPGLHEVYMAKPMWIWDRLREKYGDDIIARYFQTKRKLIKEGKLKSYTADDCVAVLSIAAGEDLFDWFNSLGIKVSRERASIKFEK